VAAGRAQEPPETAWVGEVTGAGAGVVGAGAALAAGTLAGGAAWWLAARWRARWRGDALAVAAAGALATVPGVLAAAVGVAAAGAELAAACVDPGRISATPPATATPATPTVAVTARS
jgi:hypothetical protein